MLEAEIKNRSNPPFDQIYASKKYEGNMEEVMEKLVILSHLDNRFIREWIQMGFNPLEYMFLGELKYPVKVLKEGFDHYNNYYKEVLTKALIKDIERIPFRTERGRRSEALIERAKKIEEREGGFMIGRHRKLTQQRIACEMLLKQIMKNITMKKYKGIKQDQEELAMKQLGKGEYSLHNIEILKKLIAEANSQIRVTKLPKNLRMYEDMAFTNVSVDNFYGHIRSNPSILEILAEREEVRVLQGDSDGRSIILAGPGEMPPELEGKSSQEILALGLKEVYKTPIGLDGANLIDSPKEMRAKLKLILDNLGEDKEVTDLE